MWSKYSVLKPLQITLYTLVYVIVLINKSTFIMSNEAEGATLYFCHTRFRFGEIFLWGNDLPH